MSQRERGEISQEEAKARGEQSEATVAYVAGQVFPVQPQHIERSIHFGPTDHTKVDISIDLLKHFTALFNLSIQFDAALDMIAIQVISHFPPHFNNNLREVHHLSRERIKDKQLFMINGTDSYDQIASDLVAQLLFFLNVLFDYETESNKEGRELVLSLLTEYGRTCFTNHRQNKVSYHLDYINWLRGSPGKRVIYENGSKITFL